ncbi:MAG TPA: hypothetical protein VGR62_17275 [Candidatus Binatia bacterium]|jgi:hypothetical protein|nr:hypothetical protein [Candidatus Binatia bacterium]
MKRLTHATLALALLAGASTARAAALTVTDCGAAPVAKVGKKTVIDRPGDDVTIQCALLPLGGTQRVEVTARSIVVDGPNGGSVASSGKGPAIELLALGTDAGGRSILVDGANITGANVNGNVFLDGPGAIELRDSGLQTGELLRITCTGAACPITLDDVVTNSNDLEITAEGTVTITSADLATSSPIDLVAIVSRTGNVILADGQSAARGASPIVCRDDILRLCPGPQCPLPVTIASVEDALAFCECDAEPTEIETGIEGNLRIEAPLGDIDLRDAIIHVGETITVTADGNVDMTRASIENCGPKTGRFTVTADTCNVTSATLLDDEPDPQPQLTCTVTGTASQLASCSAKAP